jgi:GT2 family glycosyltransferase
MTAEDMPPVSLIIPVLDDSPHSPWSIHTLLEDLGDIPGEVILVLNDPPTQRDLMEHPRVDHWCANSRNPGVARSWSMGLALATHETALVLNADLRLERRAVETIARALRDLPDAVVVGPEGDLIDFSRQESVRYLAKGVVTEPTPVSMVSGFLFGLRLDRMRAAGIAFDTRYTPCFLEEMDLGIQVLRAGLKCWTVPCQGYEHAFGVSSRDPGSEIAFLGRSESLRSIRARSLALFREKWADIL